MIVIATLFRKLQTNKDLVRPLYKKYHSRTPFDSQHVEGSQNLVKRSWLAALSSYFFITLREPHLENISLSDLLILKGAL